MLSLLAPPTGLAWLIALHPIPTLVALSTITGAIIATRVYLEKSRLAADDAAHAREIDGINRAKRAWIAAAIVEVSRARHNGSRQRLQLPPHDRCRP